MSLDARCSHEKALKLAAFPSTVGAVSDRGNEIRGSIIDEIAICLIVER
jgi:hypothetical protein